MLSKPVRLGLVGKSDKLSDMTLNVETCAAWSSGEVRQVIRHDTERRNLCGLV